GGAGCGAGRGGEEDGGERERRGEERVGQSAADADTAAAPALLERVVEVNVRGLERGREAEDDARQQRDAEREEHHARVQAYLGRARNLVAVELQEEVDAPHREQESEAPAHEREQNALRQKLTHDAPAARAQSSAHGYLLLPHGRAREHEVRDVGAR